MTISANFPNVQPSLLLDFANAKQLPPQVTFTRATTATYYDGHTTALMDQNYFTYSQDFSNAIWTVDGATKTSTNNTDPFGGSTALLLTKTAANGYSLRQYAGAGGSPANLTATISFYLKGTAGDTVVLYLDNGVNQGFTSTVTLTASWARYTLTGTFNSTAGSLTGGVSFRSPATASSVYVAFGQIQYNASATAYVGTFAQAVNNYTPVLLTAGGGQPRFDHNPTTSESLGLLFEEQRTNLVVYSSDFANANWTQYNGGVITSNQMVAPDGTLTADQMDMTSTQYSGVYQSGPAGATGTCTISVWARVTTGTQTFNLGFYNGIQGAVMSSNLTATTSWQRFTFTATLSGVSNIHINNYTASAGTIYIWGAQVEAGSFATSYIPTTSAAATRAADFASMTGGNFSSWFNNGEGTFYSEVSFPAPAYNSSNTYHFEASDGTSNNRLIGYTGGSQAQMFVSNGGATQAAIVSTSPPAINTNYRCAFLYEVNNFALSVNAQTPVTDSSGTVPSVNKLNIAANYAASEALNGWMKKLAYYPQAVTSAQLQALTS